MTPTKTCDKCTHYTPTENPDWANAIYTGSCALMGDANQQEPWVGIDRCAGWDAESYSAGVHVGPKFGCIHWERRIAQTKK